MTLAVFVNLADHNMGHLASKKEKAEEEKGVHVAFLVVLKRKETQLKQKMERATGEEEERAGRDLWMH